MTGLAAWPPTFAASVPGADSRRFMADTYNTLRLPSARRTRSWIGPSSAVTGDARARGQRTHACEIRPSGLYSGTSTEVLATTGFDGASDELEGVGGHESSGH